MTSAFIIDLQSELKPDYEYMNNTLLGMLLNATTGTLPAGSAASVPRWTGPDPVVVQVQCIFYATLCATLLASFVAMLGKQWLNQYRQNETHGSAADRSRARERKLTGIEDWKFHVVMELLPLLLQCALVLLGFGLSRYLWGLNRSVSSVVIGFTSFGLLFYLFINIVSIFPFNCPFQTPFSPLIRSVTSFALPSWKNLRQTFGPKQPPEPRALRARLDLPLSMNGICRGHDLEANATTPLFIQGTTAEGDKFDVRCIARMFVMSTDPDVVTSIMDVIPEVIWHSGIRNVPLKRIYEILMDCFDFSGPHPAVNPKTRDVTYLSARAFAHIALQRRCITQYEEDKQDSWKALCASHPLLSLTDYGSDSDLKTVLFMVDMTLGYDNGFAWEQTQMTPPHRAWMSHVLLYRAWHEGESLSEVVMNFVESSMSLKPPSDIVITDCLFIIGLMIGVPFHRSDTTVRDKRLDLSLFQTSFTDPLSLSREKKHSLGKVFGALSKIFSSDSIPPLAVRALQLVTRLAVRDVADASYGLFKAIMASNDLTDEHWEAARLAIHGAFQRSIDGTLPQVGEPMEILQFLNRHLGLQGEGKDHASSIAVALNAITSTQNGRFTPRMVECIKNFDCALPPFVKGMCSMLHPSSPALTRGLAIAFIGLISDKWFDSLLPIMEPEEMPKFCEHLAVYMFDTILPGPITRRRFFPILFGMLRSSEWREHIIPRLWGLLAHCALVEEEDDSFKWCLQNATKILEFTGRSRDNERFKWWYGTLWFHFDKLDPTVRGEVESIARDMSSGDGLSDLSLYLNLLGQEVERTPRELDGLTDVSRLARPGMELTTQLVTLEGNYHRLAQITGGQ